MQKTIKFVLIIIYLMLFVVGLSFFAWAATSENYAIPTDTLDQSGGSTNSGTYKINKQSIGQTVVGQGTSTNYKLCHGWLCGTEDPYISFLLSGVASGTTIAGVTTGITTTSNSVPFGALPIGSSVAGANLLTVTINWGSYTVTIQEDQDLTKSGGGTIAPVTANNASPAAWPTVTTGGRFGYHTTCTALGTGTPTRFVADDTYAKIETTPYEVAYNNGPVSAQNTYILYRIQIASDQTAGNYSNIVTYIITGTF